MKVRNISDHCNLTKDKIYTVISVEGGRYRIISDDVSEDRLFPPHMFEVVEDALPVPLQIVDEYNENGHLLHIQSIPGAFVRGRTREEALSKLEKELLSYGLWLGIPVKAVGEPQITELYSPLQICDADSDVIFNTEEGFFSDDDFYILRALALRSARDFQRLYDSVPDKDARLCDARETFYGKVSSTAREMYEHTKSVNSYYFGEIGVEAENGDDICSCREQGFWNISVPDFPKSAVFDGSYGEKWSLRKVCRRFIWHDRIHAKAMYRRAVAVFGKEKIKNVFCFDTD